MNCPSCEAEMVDLDGDDPTLRKCGECGGMWVDVAELNRLLLHSNLPGIETIGGKVNPDEMCGQCPDCMVELVRVEGGPRSHRLSYDTCESCGGVFLESEFQDTDNHQSAKKEIVQFFSNFSQRLARHSASG
jgi:Zn-finger nucleic acid-binding protein